MQEAEFPGEVQCSVGSKFKKNQLARHANVLENTQSRQNKVIIVDNIYVYQSL